MTHLSGRYQCVIYDVKDHLIHTHMRITRTFNRSPLTSGFVTYTVRSALPPNRHIPGLPPHIKATGALIASGKVIALSLANTSTKTKNAKTDHGVLIGTIRNKNTLQLFGYEPKYKGGDEMYVICKRQRSLPLANNLFFTRYLLGWRR